MRVMSLAVAVSIFALCGSSQSRAEGPPAFGEALVRDYTSAFNRHDLDGMLALAHPEIEWLSIDGASAVVETAGKAAPRGSMEKCFHGQSSTNSVIEALIADGPFIAVRERAEWVSESGPRAQRSLAVYEVRDRLIRRVWYYPAYKQARGRAMQCGRRRGI